MSDESSIAVTIGSKLAEGILSDGIGFGFDQLLSFAGAGTSDLKEVMAKLDEIIGMLGVLQASVDQIKKQLDQVIYNNAVAPLLQMISQNGHLQGRFKDLLSMTNQDEINETKKEIRDSIYINFAVGASVELWNNCLIGLAGNTSVIHALGKLIYNQNSSVFGPGAAKAIQTQWDYFDAHQAFTVMFLVDYYHDRAEPDSARSAINTWQQHRKAQLLSLHANTKAYDSVYTLTKGSDGKDTQQVESVSLACLPSAMIKAGNWLWLQNLVNNLPMIWWSGPLNAMFQATTNGDLSSGLPVPAHFLGDAVTDPDSWRIPQLAKLEDLFSNIKAQIGQSQDHFQSALADAGFAPADGTPVYAVWFYQYGRNPLHYRTISIGNLPFPYEDNSQPKWAYSGGFFNENDSWCKVCENVFQPACIVAYNPHSAVLIPQIFGPLLS